MNAEQQEFSRLLKDSKKSAQAVSQAVALVIRTAQQAIERVGLTEADLELFFREAGRTDALMPLLDPTYWMRGGREDIDESRKRGEAVEALMKFPARGLGLLDDDLLFTAAFGHDGVGAYLVVKTTESEPLP